MLEPYIAGVEDSRLQKTDTNQKRVPCPGTTRKFKTFLVMCIPNQKDFFLDSRQSSFQSTKNPHHACLCTPRRLLFESHLPLLVKALVFMGMLLPEAQRERAKERAQLSVLGSADVKQRDTAAVCLQQSNLRRNETNERAVTDLNARGPRASCFAPARLCRHFELRDACACARLCHLLPCASAPMPTFRATRHYASAPLPIFRTTRQSRKKSFWFGIRLARTSTKMSSWRLADCRVVPVPAGLTSLVQPLDTHCFAAMKRRIRERYTQCRSAGDFNPHAFLKLMSDISSKFLCSVSWATAFEQVGILDCPNSRFTGALQEYFPDGKPPLSRNPLSPEELRQLLPKGRQFWYRLWRRERLVLF